MALLAGEAKDMTWMSYKVQRQHQNPFDTVLARKKKCSVKNPLVNMLEKLNDGRKTCNTTTNHSEDK